MKTYSKEESINLIKKAFTEIISYLDKNSSDTKLRINLKPEELWNEFNKKISNDNTDEITILKEVLNYSVKTSHPLFMNQLYGGTNFIGILGDFFTSILNTSMYTYEVSPLMTMIEKDCIDKLGNLIGYRKGSFDGTFTSGGSISNMISMILAKDYKFPESKDKGLKETPYFSIFISEQAHYSFLKNALLLGFGKESIVKIKSDNIGRIEKEDLINSILIEENKGRIPLMVVGTIGTTINGVIDNINDLSSIAKQYNMWLHLDASYGGSLLFSNIYKEYLNEINKANSISWNLHKMLGMPLICSTLIVKDKYLLEKSLAVNAEYLFHEENSTFDLGNKSIQCGRRVDAFKLWLAWKLEGDIGFEKRINTLMTKASLLSEKITSKKNLKLLNLPKTPIVCFQYCPSDLSEEDINRINKGIRNKIFEDGKFIFNYAEIKGKTVLRCVISNPEITEMDLDNLLNYIEITGDYILNL